MRGFWIISPEVCSVIEREYEELQKHPGLRRHFLLLAVRGRGFGFVVVSGWIATQGLAMTGEAAGVRADNRGLPPNM